MSFLKSIRLGSKTMTVFSDDDSQQLITREEFNDELESKQNKLIQENGIIIDPDSDEIFIDLTKFKGIIFDEPPVAPTAEEQQTLYIDDNKWYKWDSGEDDWVIVGEGEISDDYKKILFTAPPATPTDEQKKNLYINDGNMYTWDEVNEKWDSAIKSLKYVKDYDANPTSPNKGVVLGDVDNNIASGQYSVAEGVNSVASGQGSHAEGATNVYEGQTFVTTASGKGSHAEGVATSASEIGAHSEGFVTDATGKYSHAEGSYTTASGESAHSENYYTQATGDNSHAEGNQSVAQGETSHAEGFGSYAFGIASHAEGNGGVAEGNYSHAEGGSTQANGHMSHAEGNTTKASGAGSHSEGGNTTASGSFSHAEGYGTIASASASHAEGQGTKATKTDQHVQGKYNIEDTDTSASGKYAHIVGNGTANNARSNAHTLDWEGNAWYAGKVTAGADPTADMDLVTKRFLLTQLANLEHPKMTKVETLPTTGQQTNTIYLVPKIGGGYEMYIWDEDNSDWIDLGKDEVDLSEYLKTADAETVFLKLADAVTTYLKIADAESTYRKIADSYTKTEVDNTISEKYATVAPLMDGTADVGTSTKLAREDHVHPTDTTCAPIESPTFTGTPKAPTASDALQHDTQLATTEFVAKAFESRLMNELYIMSDPGIVSVPSSTEKVIKYTPAVSQYGHYWGSAYVPFQQNATGRRAVRVERVHNNVAQLISSQDVRMAVSGTTTEVTVPFVTYLDPDDTIQVVVWQNSGSDLNINNPRIRALGFNRYVE